MTNIPTHDFDPEALTKTAKQIWEAEDYASALFTALDLHSQIRREQIPDIHLEELQGDVAMYRSALEFEIAKLEEGRKHEH